MIPHHIIVQKTLSQAMKMQRDYEFYSQKKKTINAISVAELFQYFD
jgi:hypothetical protein